MSANKKMKDATGAAKSTAGAAADKAADAEEERYIVEEDDEFEEFETERESWRYTGRAVAEWGPRVLGGKAWPILCVPTLLCSASVVWSLVLFSIARSSSQHSPPPTDARRRQTAATAIFPTDWKEPAGAARTANKNAWAKDWDDDADDNFLQDLRAELAK